MRPISLEMEGFTSFRQRASIDFSKFDLFAITGPTGAGKTSIIDAMIYALYGCTPRIGNKSIRELISQGADRLKVMLVFSSGQDQYRIARETKWTGKSSLTSLRLEQKNGDDWTFLADRVTDAESLIEKTIGLDFKGFTKSVVLPQGQFDEFLNGRPEDRRKILSDLLQLDVYGRMMQRANEIARDHKNRLDALAGLLVRDYANATRENLSGLRKELKGLKPLVKPLDSQLRSIRAAISVALQFRQNRSELAKAEAELKNLGPARTAAEKRVARVQQVINESKRKLEAIDVKINATTYDSPLRDGLIAKLHKSERLHAVDSIINELEGSQKKKSRRCAELEVLHKKSQAVHELAAKERSSVEKKLTSDKVLLRAVLSKYGSSDAIAGIIEVNRRRIKDEQRKARIDSELERLIRDQQTRAEKLSAVKKDLTRAEKQLDAARIELELLAQQHAAAELKGALEEGKPCPVCEQDVRRVPKAKRHPSIEQARKSAQTYEKNLNDLIRTNSALGGELLQLDPQLNSKKREIRETETRIGEAMGQVRALLGKPPGPDAEEKLQALSEHVSSLQEKLDETAGRLEEYREKEATAKDEAAQLKRDLSVTKSELSGALQQLAGLQIESKALRKELGKYSDLSVVKAELKKQNDAKGKFEENRRQRESESEVLSKAKDEFTDSSKLLEGLAAKENALKRNSEKLARTVNQNRDSLRSDFSDLRIDALGSDRDAAAQLERRFQDVESHRNATQKEVVRLEQQTKTLEGQIERATEMRLEMDKHKVEAAVAHDLSQALRGDQFIAFIQEEAYHRLAIDGSVHLKSLSSDRYSFDFDKDEFVVVDHWNADEPRPVTTLSGGELFLASLALALALAEGLSGLSHGRSRFALESLFLDEGFGTLDPETLDVVLQGIETLGTSDRLVGIVSHIPELADRMPSRVYVRKAVGGSSIEIS